MNAPVSRKSLFGLLLLVLAVSLFTQWSAGRQERDTGRQVAALVQPGDIRMLASETCSICDAARAWFTEYRVPYSECVIERDAACKAAFEASASPGTPVLLVRGKVQVGFSPERLRAQLAPTSRG
jgi:glutaredoxin